MKVTLCVCVKGEYYHRNGFEIPFLPVVGMTMEIWVNNHGKEFRVSEIRWREADAGEDLAGSITIDLADDYGNEDIKNDYLKDDILEDERWH